MLFNRSRKGDTIGKLVACSVVAFVMTLFVCDCVRFALLVNIS